MAPSPVINSKSSLSKKFDESSPVVIILMEPDGVSCIQFINDLLYSIDIVSKDNADELASFHVSLAYMLIPGLRNIIARVFGRPYVAEICDSYIHEPDVKKRDGEPIPSRYLVRLLDLLICPFKSSGSVGYNATLSRRYTVLINIISNKGLAITNIDTSKSGEMAKILCLYPLWLEKSVLEWSRQTCAADCKGTKALKSQVALLTNWAFMAQFKLLEVFISSDNSAIWSLDIISRECEKYKMLKSDFETKYPAVRFADARLKGLMSTEIVATKFPNLCFLARSALSSNRIVPGQNTNVLKGTEPTISREILLTKLKEPMVSSKSSGSRINYMMKKKGLKYPTDPNEGFQEPLKQLTRTLPQRQN